jgi:hypothetical protein
MVDDEQRKKKNEAKWKREKDFYEKPRPQQHQSPDRNESRAGVVVAIAAATVVGLGFGASREARAAEPADVAKPGVVTEKLDRPALPTKGLLVDLSPKRAAK